MRGSSSLKLFSLILFVFVGGRCGGQTITSSLPKLIEASGNYLFYLHGEVVTVFGNNAINQSVPEWGQYEYFNILDSLSARGFNVISENRKEGVDDSVYVYKLSRQVDSLLIAGVKAANILVLGASSGWNIALHASARLKNKDLKYVVMGGCWQDTYKNYMRLELHGHFLSIIEKSDPHKTCALIFENRKHLSSFQEIELNTGLSHGFMYKGRREWIEPVVGWFGEK